jgi:hypothetical protein
VVAGLLGGLSFLNTLRIWHERRHPDFEILLDLADAAVVLLLAGWLGRRSRLAATLLLLLALAGAGLTLLRGLPPLALLPQVVGGIFYLRALLALRFLRSLGSGSATLHR